MASTTQIVELRPLDASDDIASEHAQTSPRSSITVGEQRHDNHERLWPGLNAATITLQLSAINFLASFLNGVIVVGLPAIASDIHLSSELYLWPSSVYGLTSGSALLMAGSIADVVGSKSVDLLGCLIAGVFALAGGFSKTGLQLVTSRAIFGIGMAMHLPCSVSLVAKAISSGKARNVAFSCLGLSQPLGFSFGLVLGGVFVDTVGWRTGFYIPSALTLILAITGFVTFPKSERVQASTLSTLQAKVDWVGALLASGSLAMISYVLATLSSDDSALRNPTNVSLLVVSVLLMIAFPLWMHRQQKYQRPALIPNSLWKSRAFSSVCAMVLLVYAALDSMEFFSSLFFQEVQDTSALGASLRLLPAMIVGTIMNFATGLIVDKVPALWLVLFTSALAAISPLLMALIDPKGSYWRGAFFAQILQPMSADVLFTVGLIIVSEQFPEETQALAGAVFNTVAQFGISLGLSTMQVISNLVTADTKSHGKSTTKALLKGYQASFWAMFAITACCCVVAALGLRKVGRIGLKRD